MPGGARGEYRCATGDESCFADVATARRIVRTECAEIEIESCLRVGVADVEQVEQFHVNVDRAREEVGCRERLACYQPVEFGDCRVALGTEIQDRKALRTVPATAEGSRPLSGEWVPTQARMSPGLPRPRC